MNKKKMNTIKWGDICKSIDDGGLGIRDSKINNLALLVKICWRSMANENLLNSKILKAKYCPNKPLWEANYGQFLVLEGFCGSYEFY